MSLDELTAFLGWCTLINAILLGLSSAMLRWCPQWLLKMHGHMFMLDESALMKIYLEYLGYYKLLFIVFNLVPYLALHLV